MIHREKKPKAKNKKTGLLWILRNRESGVHGGKKTKHHKRGLECLDLAGQDIQARPGIAPT